MLTIMMFLLAVIIPAIIGVAIIVHINKTQAKVDKGAHIRYWDEKALNRNSCAILCWVIAAIMFFVAVGVSLGIYNTNVHKKAQLENFYATNSMNYADATNMSNNILLQAKFVEGFGGIGVGLAYEGQSESVSKALIEWRDAINQYNQNLAGYRAGQASWLTNWFYSDIEVEPLAIQ